jgi:hypothetical protein
MPEVRKTEKPPMFLEWHKAIYRFNAMPIKTSMLGEQEMFLSSLHLVYNLSCVTKINS